MSFCYLRDDSALVRVHLLQMLEYYLLTLLRHINIYSNQLPHLTEDIYKIIKCLKNVSNKTTVVKPHFYLLMAYLNVLRGRESATQRYLRRAQKFATSQGNKLITAWIEQNRRVKSPFGIIFFISAIRKVE